MDSEDLEAELSDLLRSGRRDAAATLALRRYGAQIYGYLAALLRDTAVADDAFAEFSEDFWRGLATFRRECSVKTYAYTIARNAGLRAIADPHRRRVREFESSELGQLVEQVRTTTALYLKTIVKDKLTELRASLTPDEQTLLILRIDRDLPWSDVATVLSLDEAAARKRFERIKEKLRDLARKHGLLE
jgi:RNA polymerase sigma-70 factor (ECF subfamily)